MLEIVVGGQEVFDEEAQMFLVQGGSPLQLEHSLVSLSKWESIYERPFLSNEGKSPEDVFEYIKCMALDPKTPAGIFHKLSEKNVEEINAYIDSKRTATWFEEPPGTPQEAGRSSHPS